MTQEHYFSLVTLKDGVRHGQAIREIAQNAYRQHQLLWKLFENKFERKKDAKTGNPENVFLFREDRHEGQLCFYLLSPHSPVEPDDTWREQGELWKIRTKPYQPKLVEGKKVGFALRANPVVTRKQERTEEETAKFLAERQQKGLREKNTKKRYHDDLVMRKKREWKQEHPNKQPDMPSLIQKAGLEWLENQAWEKDKKTGKPKGEPSFKIIPQEIQINNYREHCFYNKQSFEKERLIKVHSLDFQGNLTINDPKKFQELLVKGLGKAKGFGFGLMLIRAPYNIYP